MSSSKSLPHIFTPSPVAVNQGLCNHPGGALELFMVACNLETDMNIDVRLANTGYKPVVGQREVEEASASSSCVKTEQPSAQRKFPFSIPLERNQKLMPAAAAPSSTAAAMEH
jgi:hypothetical protein